MYNTFIAPFTQPSYTMGSKYNNYYTVNNGANTDSGVQTGRVTKVNGYSYPNRMMKVFTGQLSYVYLPMKCNEVNFDEEEVYTWFQN